jgi:death-on-curing protein
LKIITIRHVLILHELQIEKYGGLSGIRDTGMLQSAIGRPFATFGGSDLYPDIFTKTAALIQSIIKNHPFLDANKRTAFVSAVTLLEMNEYSFMASNNEVVKYVLAVANENLTVDQISKWLKKYSKKI